MKTLYYFLKEFVKSDRLCDGCDDIHCNRYDKALYCVVDGHPLSGTKKSVNYFVNDVETYEELLELARTQYEEHDRSC